jgi:hypothetical protein
MDIPENIDALLAHPHWEPLGDPIDTWLRVFPSETDTWARTTLLTWIYLEQGVMGFREMVPRFSPKAGQDEVPHSSRIRRTLRQMLRGMQTLGLVSITVFSEDIEPGTAPGSLGDGALISLNGLGLIWLRRAWKARGSLGGWSLESLPDERWIWSVHAVLADEEDEGKANDPCWVENLLTATRTGDGALTRMDMIQGEAPALAARRSVFDA